MMERWLVRSSKTLQILGLCAIGGTSCFTQELDLAAYQKKYSGSHIVRMQREHIVTLDLVKSKIEAKSSFNEDFLILTKEGAGMLSEDEIFYTSFETVENITAYAFDATAKSGKKVKATNFKTKDAETEGGVFHDDNKVTTFLYPGLNPGMIRHLNYELEHSEYRFPFGNQFFNYYPTEKTVFTIDHDTSIHLLIHDFNFDGVGIDFTEKVVKNRRIWTWTSTTIPQYKNESYSPDAFYYLPGVYAQISHYYLNGKRNNVLGNVNDLVNWYAENVDEVLKEQPSEELISITTDLVKDKTSELDKVKAIYYWVQDNVKYIAFEDGMAGFIPRFANQVCEKRFGDCKDMAVLLYKMMEIANINGKIAWIGTNSIPFKYSEFPSSAVDNHMIAIYYDGNQPLFLDATGTLQPIDLPSYSIQGKEALVYKTRDDFKIETVEIPEKDVTRIYDNVKITIDNRKVLGSCSSQLTGYYKWILGTGLQHMNEKKTTEKVESYYNYGNNSFKVTEGAIHGQDDREAILDFNFSFEIENYALTVDDEIYVNMVLSKDITKEKELKSTRLSPFIMDFRSEDTYSVTLEIPTDMKVKFIPEALNYTSDLVGFDISYTVSGNEITMKLVNTFNFLILPKDKFQIWNDYVKVVNKALGSSVVLIKN